MNNNLCNLNLKMVFEIYLILNVDGYVSRHMMRPQVPC